MSKNLQDIVNTDTFGVWKNRTNEILLELRTSIVTLDDAIGTGEENSGFLEIDGYIKASGLIETTSTDGIKTDKIQPSTALAPIEFAGDLEATGELTLISTATTPAGASNILKFYLDDGVVDGETWSVGPNDTHTRFEIKGTDLNTGDATASLLYIDDVTQTLDGNITIAPALLGTGAYGITVASWTNAITIDFAGDAAGSVSFDGSASPVEANLTVTASSAAQWTNARTVTFATGDVTGSFSIDGSADVGDVNLTVSDNSHDHTIANVTGLQTALDGKLSTGGGTVTGDITITADNETSGVKLFVSPGGGDGVVTTGDVTAFGTLSDIRRKKNIERIESALDKVSELNGYTFQYIDREDRMTGLIAQEVEKVLPEAVYATETFDGEQTKALRYGNMVGLLVEAINELREEVEKLKNS